MSADSTFPDLYADLATEKLIDIFSAAPDRLNSILKGLSVDDLKTRPEGGGWSSQEIVIHLADAEIMGAARFRQTLAEPNSTFAVYDQDKWATELSYQTFDSKGFYTALMLFDSLRINTTKLLRRTKPQDWQKAGDHPEWGPLTLRQLLELYADHGERHLAQILKLRSQLQKPLDFPLLLTKRLY